MIEQLSFKRLILRAVLRHVSPMVIRQVAVSDQMNLPEFNDIFCAVLGWSDNLGYIFRVHAQEFNSFRRKTRARQRSSSSSGFVNKQVYRAPTMPAFSRDCTTSAIPSRSFVSSHGTARARTSSGS